MSYYVITGLVHEGDNWWTVRVAHTQRADISEAEAVRLLVLAPKPDGMMLIGLPLPALFLEDGTAVCNISIALQSTTEYIATSRTRSPEN